MAHVKFTDRFDYRPRPSSVISYKAGCTYVVKRDCADQAVAAGKAVEIPVVRRRRAPAP